MKIAGMEKMSTVDFPGVIACVLFVPGCNFNCFYCHNRMLLPGGYYTEIPTKDVMSFLKSRICLLEGVVITGGEPSLQPGLIEYIRSIKKLGFKVKLDTNGSNPAIIEKILKLNICDYFAVDYKAPKAKYDQYCGNRVNTDNFKVSADPVLRTINLILDYKANIEVRTTVFPQLTIEDLVLMALELPKLPRYVLHPYAEPPLQLYSDCKLLQPEPYTQSQINSFKKIIKDYQPNTLLI